MKTISQKKNMSRRKFAGTMAALSLAPLLPGAPAGSAAGKVKRTPSLRTKLRSFDYQGVELRPGLLQKQYESTRDFYMALSDDDVLHGFREAAGLPAPGKALGGWAEPDSYVVFGQWLQAMARAARATGDTAMRDKASLWVSEWVKTMRNNKNVDLGHYVYEKMVGGLLDMHHYAGHPEALAALETITRQAIANLDRERTPANRAIWELHSGRQLEWYTVAENLYRAYALTGDTMYREFADVWLYPAYWDKFLANAAPENAYGVHAYSHVNSFSSAAMAYEVSGDARYLQIMKNVYDFLQNSQCFATGGYGPAERIMPADGALGEALTQRLDCCEVPCCSWAGFKLAKYLMMFSGEARYGDWIERLLYNGTGAVLPIVSGGKHFYYASYHLGAAMKTYSRNAFTCCSGTLFQDVAEYRELIAFKNDEGLYVNLYLPAEIEWEQGKLTLSGDYPEADTFTLRLAKNGQQVLKPFALRLRVPGWSNGMTIKVNGQVQNVPVVPGTWATLRRAWKTGDEVQLTLPLRFCRAAVDPQHPQRIALMRGPLVYAQEVVHKAMSLIPDSDDELNRVLAPLAEDPAVFRITNEDPAGFRNAFLPFYRFPEVTSYRMYVDTTMRRNLW
jgi:uncharacterized protein